MEQNEGRDVVMAQMMVVGRWVSSGYVCCSVVPSRGVESSKPNWVSQRSSLYVSPGARRGNSERIGCRCAPEISSAAEGDSSFGKEPQQMEGTSIRGAKVENGSHILENNMDINVDCRSDDWRTW